MLVCVRNPEFLRQDVWRFTQPQFHWYEGVEVKPGRWEDAGAVLCLTTGNPEFPVRSIRRSQIESIDGQAYRYQPTVSVRDRTVKIQGSRGEIYTVQVGAQNSCTCKGFQFRSTCRHITEAQA